MKKVVLLCQLLMLINNCIAQQIIVYPSPDKNFNKISDKFIVTIKQNNTVKKSIVYKTSAQNGTLREWGQEQNNSFHFTNFSFSGSVSVEVEKLNSTADTAIIRPTRLGIGALRTTLGNANRKVNFTLTKPAKVSVEFSDDKGNRNALVLFADSLENKKNVPDSFAASTYVVKDSAGLYNVPITAQTVYFKPGIYKIGFWTIPANVNHVYLAGGAYVKGYLNRQSPNSIIINGRGILSNEGYPYHYPMTGNLHNNDAKDWYRCITIKKGQNHLIEGITIIEATGFNILAMGNNITIKNVKINGFRYNNDGIALIGDGDKIIDCFVRSNDDAIVLTTATNLTVTGCVFWQLQGSVFQLGWTPHTMHDINISNCDVLHDKNTDSEGNVGFINAMNYMQASQPAIIDNVTVSNIYFDTPILRFIDIRGDRKYVSSYSAASAPMNWVYKNFRFSNIYFVQTASKHPLFFLHGQRAQNPLLNFTFENIYFNHIKSSRNLSDSSIVNVKSIKNLTVK